MTTSNQENSAQLPDEPFGQTDAALLATWFNQAAQDEYLTRHLLQPTTANRECSAPRLLSYLDQEGGADAIHAITRRTASMMDQALASRLAQLVAERITRDDLEHCVLAAIHPELVTVQCQSPDQPGHKPHVAAIRRQATHTASVIQECRNEIAQGLQSDDPARCRDAIREAAQETIRLESVITTPHRQKAN